MKAFSVVVVASMLVMTSCQKDESTNNTPKTKTELITSASWKYNDAKIDTDNNGTGDVALPAGFIESCQTDNVIIFAAGGTGTVDEGAFKCDPADPQSIPFTWSFTSNETMINFSSAVFAGIGGDFKIISLTETELKISQQVTIPPSPIALSIVATFKH